MLQYAHARASEYKTNFPTLLFKFEFTMYCMYVLITTLLVLFVHSPVHGQTEPLEPEWCRQLPRSLYKTLERIEIADDWFEVYRIHPGVFAIYEPHQYEEVISYLILGSKKALLFDTGMGIGRIRKVAESLTSVPLLILNSHTHPDHIGGNHEFENILALDTNFTRKNSRGFSGADVKAWVQPPRVCGSLPKDFDPNTYTIRGFSTSRYISDGEILDLGDRKLEVIRTPGHTPDALCILDRKNRLLFTGDTFYLGPIYLYLPETDFAAYMESVTRLEKLTGEIDLLLPAHNVPIASVEFLTRLKEAVEQVRSGTAKAILKDGLREFQFDGFSLLLSK